MAGFEKLLIIGCGNMGGAMLAGWLDAGIDPARFTVLDPGIDGDGLPQGVAHLRELPPETGDGLSGQIGHDAVLLGFKPQQLARLAPGLQPAIGDGIQLYSLLAGIGTAQLQRHFPNAAAHIRVMPNLAAKIRKSPVILAGRGLGDGARQMALEFFGLLGSAHWLEDEGQFDLVTALAGSGPGFVYRFIDALAAAAIELGLPPEMAGEMAVNMVEGASALAADADIPPSQLADQVASPGGMTREGLNVLDDNNQLKTLLFKVLQATRDRGAELSKIANS